MPYQVIPILKYGVIVTVIAPYVLVTLFCLMIAIEERYPKLLVPHWLYYAMVPGGFIALDARQSSFSSYMLWFPAFVFVSLVSYPAAVCVLFLHLGVAGLIYLSREALDAILKSALSKQVQTL